MTKVKRSLQVLSAIMLILVGVIIASHSHKNLVTNEDIDGFIDMSNYVECAECGILVSKDKAVAERTMRQVADSSRYTTLVLTYSGNYYSKADIDIDRNGYFIATTYYCTHCKPKKTVSNIWFSPDSSSIHYNELNKGDK